MKNNKTINNWLTNIRSYLRVSTSGKMRHAQRDIRVMQKKIEIPCMLKGS